ncbi:hypothetical protein RHMOL_Rhmol12G0247700 [Rhododendron molle]|uniref:Uncharacterized protein n=1 Tax=Rhododendron molle TaxID=49168 RepID=A0ACC0LM77_RHOML|nr:hypothetical protein RHMOL_Rhmol12G0247700 [Rhododendron molle]
MEEDSDDEDYQPQSSSSDSASPSSSPPLNNTGKNGGGGGGRCIDDCWSEGAASVQFDAWGKRYLERNRQHIQRNEVADTVSRRQNNTRTLEKTGIQCVNRMDRVKRQYKEEKQKIIAAGGGPSNWPFLERMDRLIGSTGKKQNHQTQKQWESSDGSLPEPKRMRTDRVLNWNWNRNSEAKVRGSSEGRGRNWGDSVSELTRAVGEFVEAYERVENSKLERGMEMEKQRMEFEKGIEKQRMQFLKDAQLDNARMNQKSKARFSERGQGRRKDCGDSVSELTRAVAEFVEAYERVENSKLERVMEMEKQKMEFEKGIELHRMQFLKDAQLEISQMNCNRKVEPSNQKKQKQEEEEPDHGTEQEPQQEQE